MTTRLFKILFVISLCKFSRSLIWKKFDLLERCAEPYGSEIKFFYSTSISGCAAQCNKEPDCLSAIYGTDKTCIINSETLADNANGCNNQVTYIEKHSGSSVMGPCSTDPDCLTVTSYCNEGMCDCNLGYSYIMSNDTCVELCDEYGATFSKGTHHKLSGHNKEKFENITIEQLKVECVSASFTCRSIEYKPLKRVGQLQKETVLTKSEDVSEDATFAYYQRNCK